MIICLDLILSAAFRTYAFDEDIHTFYRVVRRNGASDAVRHWHIGYAPALLAHKMTVWRRLMGYVVPYASALYLKLAQQAFLSESVQ